MIWSTLVKVNSSSTNEPIWTRNESDRYDARDEPDETELNEVGRGDFVSVSDGGRPESVEPVSESRDEPRVVTLKPHFDEAAAAAMVIGDGGSYLMTIDSWLIGPRSAGGGAGVRVSMFSLKRAIKKIRLIQTLDPRDTRNITLVIVIHVGVNFGNCIFKEKKRSPVWDQSASRRS